MNWIIKPRPLAQYGYTMTAFDDPSNNRYLSHESIAHLYGTDIQSACERLKEDEHLVIAIIVTSEEDIPL